MFKAVRHFADLVWIQFTFSSIATPFALFFLFIEPLALRVQAQEADTQAESTLDLSGICSLYDRSGYLVVDETGTLVDVVEYCQRQQGMAIPSVFWQIFESTANLEALAVAQSLGVEAVATYGTTICPFFEQGGTIQELRQIQSDGDLPFTFEVAVTVAAVHAYCPIYRSELGR